VETLSVEAVLASFQGTDLISGYTANIQGDLAVSANKRGVLIEPMSSYRARRKKN
jgi:tRNA(Ile)-lysidine synthase